MGNAGSAQKFEPNTLLTWDIRHVQSLHKHFVEGNYSTVLDKPTWVQLLTSSPVYGANKWGLQYGPSEKFALELWEVFDDEYEPGVQSGCILANEAIGGLCAFSVGRMYDKLELVYDLAAEAKGGATYDELIVATCSAFCGAAKIMQVGRLANEQDVETFVQEMFLQARKSLCETITRTEYMLLAKTTGTQESNITDLMTKFGLVKMHLQGADADADADGDAEEEDMEEEDYD